jgi:hypothetical protein
VAHHLAPFRQQDGIEFLSRAQIPLRRAAFSRASLNFEIDHRTLTRSAEGFPPARIVRKSADWFKIGKVAGDFLNFPCTFARRREIAY